MSIMKGKLRRSAVVVAFSLGAFQALSIVGATQALAATTCAFTATAEMDVAMPAAADAATLQVQNASGQIWVNGAACVGAGGTALISNTTSIVITGGNLTNQTVTIDMFDNTGVFVSWGTINWTIAMGSEAANPPGDALAITGAGVTDGTGVDIALGVSGIDLNNDGDLDATITGFETYTLTGTPNIDTIWAAGSTATGAAFAGNLSPGIFGGAANDKVAGGSGNDQVFGEAGNDTVSGGLGDDNLSGGANTLVAPQNKGDIVDYSGSVTAVTVNLTTSTATGEGLDTLPIGGVTDFESITGSAQADTLTGNATGNYIKPGKEADHVNGGAGSDWIDTSTSNEDETVDLIAGTATGGDGADVLTSIENVQTGGGNDSITGSDLSANILFGGGGNDLIDPGADDGFNDSVDGESGIDTVDYSTYAEAVTVDLTGVGCSGDTTSECDDLAPQTVAPAASNENAILSAFDDTFIGTVFNNIVWPNGGQNSLLGDIGIDTLNYSVGYTAGITINLSGGGASGGGQDSIGGFENAVGTAFNDQIFGTDLVAATNGANLLVGGKGNDLISANAGPDFVRGGAGNDRVRGGSGDDTLKGQGGKDNIRGGTGDDDIFGGKGNDFCIGGGGHDFIKTCERPRHHHQGPNGPGVAHAARLSAIKS